MAAVTAQTSVFKPVTVSANPRMWKGDIGLMNTSKTSVVFTIDSLVEFLKNLQIEVDSNLNEFKNLPRYASFGRMEAADLAQVTQPAADAVQSSQPAESVVAQQGSSTSASHVKESQQQFASPPVEQAPKAAVPEEPSRLARASHAATTEAATDRDAFVPTRKVREPPGGGTLTIGNLFGGDENEPQSQRRHVSGGRLDATFGANGAQNDSGQGFIPTRKVREPPGGKSQMSAILFG